MAASDPALADFGARVEAEARRLQAEGVYVSPDSERRIGATTAAQLLGRSPKTLANWAATDGRGPARLGGRRGRPVQYRLGEVLAYRDELGDEIDVDRIPRYPENSRVVLSAAHRR